MIAQFALRLICGMSLMWALMPRRQVTSGFFRIQMLVVMGLGVLAALSAKMAWMDGPAFSEFSQTMLLSDRATVVAGGIIGFAGFVGSALWTLERRAGGERIGFLILAAATFALTLTNVGQQVWTRWPAWLAPISHLAGAAVLGATTVGMLLGHWYLTAPTMSIEPLKRINFYLCLAGCLRLLMSTLMLALAWFASWWEDGSVAERLKGSVLMILSVRWLAGVIGPLVISLMVWRILKYRNTQAATGVLFVGVILAFMADMMAALLLQETKIPL